MDNTIVANSAAFDFQLTARGLHVRRRDGEDDALLPWLWLRDHCRAEHSFNRETGQRRQTPAELDLGIAVVGLQWRAEEDELVVQWNNDEPPGHYPAEFFIKSSPGPAPSARNLSRQNCGTPRRWPPAVRPRNFRKLPKVPLNG